MNQSKSSKSSKSASTECIKPIKYINNLKKIKQVKQIKQIKQVKKVKKVKEESSKTDVTDVIKKPMIYKNKDRGDFTGIELIIPKSVKFLGFCCCDGIITVKDKISESKYYCPMCDDKYNITKLSKTIDINNDPAIDNWNKSNKEDQNNQNNDIPEEIEVAKIANKNDIDGIDD